MGKYLIPDKVVGLFYRTLYRPLMRLAHRFHWHYAPPIYPDGDTVLWCKWCGLQQVIKRRGYQPAIGPEKERDAKS